MSYTIHHGDCLDVLKTMDENSVDSIVTDPPYGLSFMGKAWDHSVPSAEVWAECLRVLKPGGHLLAFAGTRTQHRMAVNIEDAGFEIRDMIAWVYGSGFPKSLDVSKAIDKRGGSHAEFNAFRDDVKKAMAQNGVSRSALQDALGNFMLSHYLTAASQPAVPNLRDYLIIREMVKLGDKWDKQFLPEAEREVIAKQRQGKLAVAPGQQNDRSATTLDITAPATEAAQQWQGWGTALKPALEPITVARKPLKGTVAENVLTHGTGAINVDGCRVGTDENLNGGAYAKKGTERDDGWGMQRGGAGTYNQPQGRWPANFIHDGSDEAVTLLGDPARYFYCAKASKKDRDEGCEGMEAKPRPTMGNGIGGQPDQQNANNRNFHPTVKPTDLMRYLVRLVTPPNGTVLDPFMGSGSTGKGAVIEGFDFIGIELDADYIEIARARIEAVDPDQVLNQQALKRDGKI